MCRCALLFSQYCNLMAGTGTAPLQTPIGAFGTLLTCCKCELVEVCGCLLLSAEKRLREQPPQGLSPQEVAVLGEALVKAQAVPASLQCQHAGCNAAAAVVCHGCKQGGMMLCEAHDQLQHCWAHTHQRDGLLNGCRQPLRPTQLEYDAEQQTWLDLPRCYDQPPHHCGCGHTQFTLSPITWQHEHQQKLVVITGYGVCMSQPPVLPLCSVVYPHTAGSGT